MKLSPREKVLAMAVGGCVFILLNLWLLSAFSRRNATLRIDLVQRRTELANIQDTLAQRDLFAARDAAITGKQPRLVNDNAAAVELLDSVRDLAKKHNVTTENEVLGVLAKSTWYRSVPITLDTHSSWSDLIAFLYALQKPDQFTVCESANIQLDPSDPAKMSGHFKIGRWYAP